MGPQEEPEKQNCANWTAEGGCYLHESVTFSEDGIPQLGIGQCRPAEGKPCDYFRKAILPAENCAQRIRESYLLIDRKAKVKDRRRCPECGAELQVRRRLCEECARKHRQASYRKRRQKDRMSAPQLTAV